MKDPETMGEHVTRRGDGSDHGALTGRTPSGKCTVNRL